MTKNMNTEGNGSRFKTIEEAAAYLNISVRQFEVYRKSGRIPAIKMSHKVVRFDVRDLDAFAEACRESV